MRFRGAGRSSRPSRRRAAVALVAGLSLVAAALGCWTLRAETAAGPSGTVVASVSVSDVAHADFGSTLNDDKAFKSGGLKRDRAPGFPTPAPRASWSPTSPAPAAWTPRAGEPCCRVSAAVLAGQNLLAHLCVCRC